MKLAIRMCEFIEDKDGLLSVQVYTPDYEVQLKWSQFAEADEHAETLNKIFDHVTKHFPFLLPAGEFDGTDIDHRNAQLRRFVSQWLGDTQKGKKDWYEFSDGTTEMNLDEKFCGQNCPLIKEARKYFDRLGYQDDGGHPLSYSMRKYGCE